MGERVSQLAGLKPEDLRPVPVSAPADGGRGGPSSTLARPSSASITALLASMDQSAALNADVFTLVESRLMADRLEALMVPSSAPVDGPVGSGFGFRLDPIDGHRALHTGLDFPAVTGHAVLAAAGGVVVSVEQHAEYGTLLTLDHGNHLLTRYAHLSRVQVGPGDLVRRRQPVGEVGTTGRSTGPHLHFEVLVQGVPQNPARFLAGRAGPPGAKLIR
jgi:murein DD-endopeptidase MepM/ murein hydrolase activator NlpD